MKERKIEIVQKITKEPANDILERNKIFSNKSRNNTGRHMQRQRGLVKTATNMSIIWKIELTSLYRAFVAKLPCQLSNSRCLLASRDRWKASGSHPWYCTRGSRVSGMLINVPGRVRKTGWRERVARNNDNNVFRSECPAISSPACHFSRRWGRTFISQGWLMVPARLKKRTLETQEERPTRNVKIIIRGIYQAGRLRGRHVKGLDFLRTP